MTDPTPRPEFPRPDFIRSQWLNLNGEWGFRFDDTNMGEKEKWFRGEVPFSDTITVPYCFQSKASGINDTSLHEIFWYSRTFELPRNFSGKRTLLKFGAVDYFAKVWLNGELLGSHKGGNVPFHFEITDSVLKEKNSLVIRVEDRYDTVQPRGKQYWKEETDRCWYIPTSGIWQTVWLESAGETAIENIRMTPDIDRRTVQVELTLDQNPADISLEAEISFGGSPVNCCGLKLKERVSTFTIDIRETDDIDENHYWTPENPNLYDIKFTLKKGSETLDQVDSYFGMRKISIDNGRILLNNRPLYQRLVLDQGYWPDTLLTPPSDDAIKYDIELTKKMGFNGARKHQKIEDPRYYYWADKLGLLVWGEMPSAYRFCNEEIENITSEWTSFIRRDYNHPCIITWVPLNESWGVRNIYSDKGQQNFARGLYLLTKGLDQTRLVSTNDGWEMVESDIYGVHDYAAYAEDFLPKYKNPEDLMKGHVQPRMLLAMGCEYNGNPILVTEYGGIAFESGNSEEWGYNSMVKTEEEFLHRYNDITTAIVSTDFIAGYCYTQLTDVMQEINGLLTPDRELKLNIDEIKKINS